MTLQLDWPPDVVERLRHEAAQSGRRLEDYILESVLSSQRTNRSADAAFDDEATCRRRSDAVQRIMELSAANVLGPDLTIRDLIEEGRRF